MQPGPNSDPNQPRAATAEEQLVAQTREIQELREQLARVFVKEGPALPPLSIPETNKALERAQLTQWMRLNLSTFKAYVRVCAGEVGQIPRPVEFKSQVANTMMDPGEQLGWRTWDYLNQSLSAYTRRYAGSAGISPRSAWGQLCLEECQVQGSGGCFAVANVPR